MQLTIVGNPENRRVTLFCEAAQRLGYPAPTVLSYLKLLSGKERLVLPPHAILKIDSPGENTAVRQLLIDRGQPTTHPPDISSNSPIGTSVDTTTDHGRIANMQPWYAGYCQWLDECQHALDKQPGTAVMNTPEDIKLHFDKPRCQQHLQTHHIPVPARLPQITGYDDLNEKMHAHGLSRVFIKPAHASSASGVIAFRTAGSKVQAITSAELVQTPTGVALYNSLTVRTYTREEDIAKLVDHLAQENIFAEEWLPKATLNNRYFDIRVLVIAGKARHLVLRTSKTTITNLHLGNKRGDLQEFISIIGEERLTAIKQLAEQTAACFPSSLYMGVDILLTADLRSIFVLETNAFGDLLPGLIDEGETCYEAQINAMSRKPSLQWNPL